MKNYPFKRSTLLAGSFDWQLSRSIPLELPRRRSLLSFKNLSGTTSARVRVFDSEAWRDGGGGRRGRGKERQGNEGRLYFRWPDDAERRERGRRGEERAVERTG